MPQGHLRILRSLTTRLTQIADMRQRRAAQICACGRQGIAEELRDLDSALKDSLATKARLLHSIPGIGPVSAAMLIAEMPELGRMTAGEAAACHNPVLKPLAKRLKERGKPHKPIIIAVARRLVTIANAVLKTTTPWQTNHVD